MRLVVIGGVAAGLSAAARARRLDPSLEIVVLEKGALISYGACGLPYYIEGQVGSLEELVHYSPEEFSRQRNIAVRTNAPVVSIQHARREVTLAGGERVHYDRLAIATGARPDARWMEGIAQPHVFTLHTFEDARRLKAYLGAKRPRRAVVIGAGYIGLEMAGALRAQGLQVAVVQQDVNVLHREDPELTQVVARHLERFGIRLRCGVTVRAIEPGQVAGESCDLVVVAAGLKPNVELAADAGIEIGRTGAIRTTDRMETSHPGIYAAGDCAETGHVLLRRPVWIPLGTTANRTGRVAGANAAGRRERFSGVAGTSLVRVCGLGVGVTGLSAPQARREGFEPVTARITSRDRPRYFWGKDTTVELVADRRTGKLIGGSVIGSRGLEGRINVIATAITRGMKVEEFEDLDLAYTPPYSSVWDPLLIAAQQLTRALLVR